MSILLSQGVLSQGGAGFSDNFNRADGAPGSPWTVGNIGTIYSAAGYIEDNQLVLYGQGSFFTAADNGSWVYKTAPTGNFRSSVVVESSTDYYCRHIMFRESLDAASPFVSTLQVLDADEVSLVWRDSYGAEASWTGGAIGTTFGPYIGSIHSLDYADGWVTLRDSAGTFICSRVCPFVPAYVGLTLESMNVPVTPAYVVYDNYSESNI